MHRSDFDFDVISGPAEPVRRPDPEPKPAPSDEVAKAAPAAPK